MRSPYLCVCVSIHPYPGIAGPILMKLSMYIMAPEPISTAYFINSSPQSLFLNKYKQRLIKSFTAATNAYSTLQELLNESSLMRYV
jgi:hypothetical protein